MKKEYLLIFFSIVCGCKNTDSPISLNKNEIILNSDYKYWIIGSDDSPVLALMGKIESKASLKDEFSKRNFDYARLDCQQSGKFKVYAYISIKEEKKIDNNYESDILLKICPKNDENNKFCISDLNELSTLKNNLKCEVIFGGMTKPKIVVSDPLTINIKDLQKAVIFNSE